MLESHCLCVFSPVVTNPDPESMGGVVNILILDPLVSTAVLWDSCSH